MKYISLGLLALLTIAFVGAGAAKLAGVDMMVATYDTIGMGQWFRYLTGIVEIGGAALLWLPGRQVVGAGLLGATMVAASLARQQRADRVFLGTEERAERVAACGSREDHRRTGRRDRSYSGLVGNALPSVI